jgi:hypothetical protein
MTAPGPPAADGARPAPGLPPADGARPRDLS